MTLRFACGHAVSGADITTAQCQTCGERRVSHVQAPPPRFTGLVLGPCATFQDLPAQPVSLTTKET